MGIRLFAKFPKRGSASKPRPIEIVREIWDSSALPDTLDDDKPEDRLGEQSNEILAASFENSVVPSALVDLEGKIRAVNHAFYRISGYPRPEIFNRRIYELFDQPSQKALHTLTRTVLLKMLPAGGFPVKLLCKDSTTLEVEIGASTCTAHGISSSLLVFSLIDVTELRQKQARKDREDEILRLLAAGERVEVVLQKTIALLRSSLPETQSIFFTFNRDKNVLECAAVAGVSQPRMEEIVTRFRRSGLLSDAEPYFVLPNAEVLRQLQLGGVTFERIISSRGEILGAVLLLSDSSPTLSAEDRKHLEQAIHFLSLAFEQHHSAVMYERQQQILRAVIDLNPNMIFAKDCSGRYLLVNRTMSEFYSTSPAEMLGKKIEDLNENQEQIVRFSEEDRRVIEHGEEIVIPEQPVTDHSGRTRILRVVKRPLRGDDGAIDRIVGTAMDITELKRAEEERVQFEKRSLHQRNLERLGTLAGGIAHDFNNLLQVITGRSSLALLSAQGGVTSTEHLHEIRAAAMRAGDLVGQLLAYSGQGHSERKDIDLSQVSADAIQALQRVIPQNVSVIRSFAPTPLPFHGDGAQIQKLITNLVLNSTDALTGNNGIVKIETGTASLTSNDLRSMQVSGESAPGDFVFVDVSDTGSGIESSLLGRIFEPFFTTKMFGRGMGLSAVLGIARNHHAAIHVSSSPGMGSSFRVFFPLASPLKA